MEIHNANRDTSSYVSGKKWDSYPFFPIKKSRLKLLGSKDLCPRVESKQWIFYQSVFVSYFTQYLKYFSQCYNNDDIILLVYENGNGLVSSTFEYTFCVLYEYSLKLMFGTFLCFKKSNTIRFCTNPSHLLQDSN